eukprot:GILI01011819.1.p1 GENE.GILI01011819.1~~GILI01011819.1.p1  ORF type:complete len:442 (-),score=95.47 GILI01011819.1:178-1503(-)
MPTEKTSLVSSTGAADYSTIADREMHIKLSSPKPMIHSGGIASPTIAADDRRRKRELLALTAAMIFCLIFMCVELLGGYLAHSLAILTDAAHLFTDVGSYFLSILALRASARARSSSYSYGWHRAEVVGTLFSIFTIWALVGGILVEAINRSVTMWECAANPKSPSSEFLCEGVDSKILIIVGTLGLIVNFGCAGILKLGGSHGHSHFGAKCEGHGGDHGHSHDEDDHGHSHEVQGYHHEGDHHDHSHDDGDHGHSHDDHAHSRQDAVVADAVSGFAINAAMLHALSDSVQSAGVILAGIFMYYMINKTEGTYISKHSWYNLADPACSVFFAVITVYMTKGIIKDLMNILMEASPLGIDAAKIEERLREIPGVIDLHDLHVWSIASGKISLSVHLVSDTHVDALAATQRVLEHTFGITHHTVQVDPVQYGSDKCSSNICQH